MPAHISPLGAAFICCIGNMLARKELSVAFEELLARLDSFRLIGGEEDLRHAPSAVLRGLTQLNKLRPTLKLRLLPCSTDR